MLQTKMVGETYLYTKQQDKICYFYCRMMKEGRKEGNCPQIGAH